jgi:nitroreductase
VETWRAIQTRRNVREFADRPIDPELLDRLVDAARHAPSSMNGQRWGFVAVTDRQRLARLASLGEWAGHAAGAGAAIAVVAPTGEDAGERESIAFDLGQAVQNLMLAAWEQGIGSCHATVDRPDDAASFLGLPEGWRCDLVISLGYPADPTVRTAPPRAGGRRPLEDVLRRERWQP